MISAKEMPMAAVKQRWSSFNSASRALCSRNAAQAEQTTRIPNWLCTNRARYDPYFFFSTSPTETRLTYTYDGDGLKRSENSGAGVTTLVWDGREYVREVVGGALTKRYQSLGMVLQWYEVGASRKDYATDHLGSVLNEVDGSQVATYTGRYKPYGKTVCLPEHRTDSIG
jgi:YD repeat-containing protein